MSESNKYSDIIKTIYEDEDVENFSGSSDEEVTFQPSKAKKAKTDEFNKDFTFMSSVEEYNKDPWNDLAKYIKRKAKSKTDDKIQKVLQSGTIQVKEESDSDLEISDDELKFDYIKDKVKKKKDVSKDEFFEHINDINTIENASFYNMNLSRPLLKAIGHMNYVHPTPIQAATVPVALLGKDICGCAATGTGKTAAYMLPTLERLLFRPSSGTSVTRVLVLVPTRELGVQVYQVSKQLCQYTDIHIGLAVGGLDVKAQETDLRKKPDIVIATPGRLIDHLKNTPSFGLDSVEILILDEADRMLDEYFAEQMKEIIKQCSRTRQTMLFSATMTDEVESLAAVSLKKPVRLFVDSNQDVAFNLRQEFVRIRPDKETDREPLLAALVCRTFRESCMVFVQTKKQAHRLHILLGLLGLKVGELHGNLTQPQRLDALQKFKDKQIDILVATDVAARGLDIDGVQTVINFCMPRTVEHYIHRVGRTARAGRAGVSVSLAGEHERKMVKEIIKKAQRPVKSRVIPSDILEKYRNKLENLETKIQEILQEELEERLLSKAENKANRLEKVLKNEQNKSQTTRTWFQTKKQRQEEKERLGSKSAKSKDKKENKNKKKDTSAVRDPLEKVAFRQAKLAKRQNKMKKMYTVEDKESPRKIGAKRKKSNFDNDMFNPEKAKKFRHQAKKEKGKAFGQLKNRKTR